MIEATRSTRHKLGISAGVTAMDHVRRRQSLFIADAILLYS